MVEEHRFNSAPAMNAALAQHIAAQLRAAVDSRGQALIALSGGTSPKPLFEQLSRLELPWSKVTISQVDERWLPQDHADSNARLIREHLLREHAAEARFLPMKNAAATPEQGQATCEAQLRALPLPFDVMVLGMGEDGHTASLFPRAPELASALQADAPLCLAVRPAQAPHPRMSLSLSGLLSSRRLLLPISGAAKQAVLRQALQAGAIEAMPVRAVLRQTRVPVELWCSP